ncbi:hypothetical protein MPER_01614 [Moniliophthora perniciosa FA553]|nr:hypothetical protein MPER_01614 [Moniliophthora perniciosa FA553]
MGPVKRGFKSDFTEKYVLKPFIRKFNLQDDNREQWFKVVHRFLLNGMQTNKPVGDIVNDESLPPAKDEAIPVLPQVATTGNTATTAAGPSTSPSATSSASQVSPLSIPRLTNAMNEWRAANAQDIRVEARKKAPGLNGGPYLEVWKATRNEMWNKVPNKQYWVDVAAKKNEGRSDLPPAQHVAGNQEVIGTYVGETLNKFIGNNWGQCGDVAFVVHILYPLPNGETEVEMYVMILMVHGIMY